MAREWMDWGFINPDRINGRKIGVRYNDYANTDADGQLRMEDGRIIDFQQRHEAGMVKVSNGPLFYGSAWIMSNDVKYASVFDLIAAMPPNADPTIAWLE